MAKTIYMSTQCSFIQMPLHINGPFVDSTFLFLFLFSAISDLLDNAVDEVICECLYFTFPFFFPVVVKSNNNLLGLAIELNKVIEIFG
ncbi:unnamed protein product [Prunus armeniaca]|uniref:Uncharacterized protein n=1 Tax=Prunus armeniaca TaxID=36596 RepID=A0A6J5TK03_PRUAR|nr:unnamed protein product [Prunus armeniaca]